MDGGLDLDLLAAADGRIQGLPELRNTESLVVVHGGEVAFERYYRGRSPEDFADTHSVTKSFTSAVIGALVSDGTLDLDMRVASPLHAAGTSDVATNDVTVRHLLTMTSGLPADGRWELCEVALHGGSWIETMLGAPVRSAPGAEYAYNNGALQLLSAVIRQATDVSLGTVAAQRLLGPLGVDRYEWPADPDGQEIASRSSTHHASRYGQVGAAVPPGRRVGRSTADRRGYVEAATARQAPGRPFPEAVSYGYLWWVDDLASPLRSSPAGTAASTSTSFLHSIWWSSPPLTRMARPARSAGHSGPSSSHTWYARSDHELQPNDECLDPRDGWAGPREFREAISSYFPS